MNPLDAAVDWYGWLDPCGLASAGFAAMALACAVGHRFRIGEEGAWPPGRVPLPFVLFASLLLLSLGFFLADVAMCRS
jgi:hypothetical protein